MNDGKKTLEMLCLEAVRQCGTDFAKVQTYVLRSIEDLDPADRDRVTREVRRLLSFQSPGFSEHGPN